MATGFPLRGDVTITDGGPAALRFSPALRQRGAIEGGANDYAVRTPFATAFTFTRFDAVYAHPRNTSMLGLPLHARFTPGTQFMDRVNLQVGGNTHKMPILPPPHANSQALRRRHTGRCIARYLSLPLLPVTPFVPRQGGNLRGVRYIRYICYICYICYIRYTRQGGDLRGVRGVRSASACRTLCLQEARCVGFTFIKPPPTAGSGDA